MPSYLQTSLNLHAPEMISKRHVIVNWYMALKRIKYEASGSIRSYAMIHISTVKINETISTPLIFPNCWYKMCILHSLWNWQDSV